MGRGYTSYNVWPNQKPNATDLELQPKVSLEKVDEKEARTAEAIVKILEPLIASLVKLKEPEKKDQPDSAKQREKYFIIGLIVFGLFAFFSFLSALWSANSVEKLLRIIYKLKQAKP
jgi:hypothetical protein